MNETTLRLCYRAYRSAPKRSRVKRAKKPREPRTRCDSATARANKSAREREVRRKRKEAGLCYRCGSERGESGTKWMCRPCADYDSKRMVRRAAEAARTGLCEMCKREREPAGSGSTQRRCAKCAEARRARRREVRRAQSA